MRNFIKPGKSIVYLNGTGGIILSGGMVAIGNLFGVSVVNCANGATANMNIEGIYELPVHSGTIPAMGTQVFYDATNHELNTDRTKGIFAGTVADTVSIIPGTARVLLPGSAGGGGVAQGANIPAVATANATDLASAEALANQLKITLNQVVAALKSSGVTL